ncbi:sugar phosphate isomerase/epimerase [Maribacter polysiphoniae]|uniref:Sugar phosphate isomerase/epimerase n=2 Tax=Maribacter polysiphoniae TaxID=429344 RepID=A0ABR7VY19_9FLAO|nr:sugar phosphate isomerase/epimerase family protein [Maribacter polysiphoniae]MBD1260869.1 sugar phosphate isomerase/epimerase [Maribacter polysiphoniae]
MKNKMNTLAFACCAIFLFSTTIGCKNKESKPSEAEATEVQAEAEPDFKISLAQWSLHKTFFGGQIDWENFGKTLKESPDDLLKGPDPMEFPAMAAAYGINTIELVNTFYFSKGDDKAYWTAFKKKCDEAGVTVGLIMCDALGNLGDADPEKRKATVENHYKWVDIAEFLGAHSIRVNAAGEGTAEEVAEHAVAGLKSLAEYGAAKGINIIVENHGGYSSDGTWLSGVMDKVGMDNVGTLPDFGNFCIERGPDGCIKEYDRYKGIAELMPYAKGVSAKSHNFDENGNEVDSDFLRIMKIVKESGFKGYVGIEYEGTELSEDEGIKATKALLEKVFAQLQ